MAGADETGLKIADNVSAKGAKGKGKTSLTRSNGDLTRDKILNSAELLFGAQPYDAVSLRDITKQADVTLALASYHFGTKESLFAEVIARRAGVLARMRRVRLSEALARGDMTLETILDAFMKPLFQQMQSGDDGWQAYVHLLSQLGSTNRWLDLIRESFDETALMFLHQLRPVLPNVSEEELQRGFSFVLQLMLQTVAKHQRINSLSNGAFRAEDLDASYKTLLQFAIAGLRGLGSLEAATASLTGR